MSNQLPPNPNLIYLKKQAKALHKQLKAGEPAAAARCRQSHPQGANLTTPKLSDAQLIIAREHGFSSWPRLKHYVEGVRGRPLHRAFETDIDYYEGRAFGLYSVYQTGQPRALNLIRQSHPHFAYATDEAIRQADFTLDDARLVLAREHGFADWPALAAHVERLAQGQVVEPFRIAFQAIKKNDLDTFKQTLASHPELATTPGTNGNGLLHLAADFGRVEMVRLLLAAGADINMANNKGWTLLHCVACASADGLPGGPEMLITFIDLLLAAGADVTAEAHGAGGTPLMQALFWGRRLQAERLAQEGTYPYNLRAVAGLGRLDLVADFFHSDGSLKPEAGQKRAFHRPHSGFPPWTPKDDRQEILNEALVYAAKSGRTDVLPYLLAQGANINGEPYNGTALFWAVSCEQTETARWLLEHGADVHHIAGFGGEKNITALHVAAWGGHLEPAKVLLQHGAEATFHEPRYGSSPVGWADHMGHHQVRDYLLEHAPLSLEDAAFHGRLERVKELVEANPTLVNGLDGKGAPLRHAATAGHMAIVQYLLDKEADRALPDSDGKIALDFAREKGHQAVVDLLQNK
ncbi:MAG: ankyrin repeat domain-containing protein [Chloroflexi bacterium]|nr:ankyrin repeat domain-containing protein [Chloroflexota bacterium]MCI0576014.1 ankyrin repeat domain-containing protein [Chloroflexota bacterium]MCI0645138.1 ankyrin repeat domain-containing protein [Chloroflexota bacterium]MCI0725618.1 ankyrin repeat domain-containing protein [Chloroflexota bacterium]